MNKLKAAHQNEPVVTWGTVAMVFNALQLLALPGFPLWVHTVILVIATVVSIFAARTQTVPANNPEKVNQAAKDLGLVEDVIKHV